MIDLSNTALLTHLGCMDGSVSAVLFRACGGLKENIHFVVPNHRNVEDMLQELLDYHDGPILLVDVSISLDFAKKIQRTDVLLLDHHSTATPLDEVEWCEIDLKNGRCGSMMFYDFLIGNGHKEIFKYSKLVGLSDDYDRWIKNYPESEKLVTLHDVLSQEVFVDRFCINSQTEFTNNEIYIIGLEEAKRNNFIRRKKKEATIINKNIDGENYRIAFVKANIHQSILGNAIVSDPQLDCHICVMVGDSVSLRSRSGLKVDLGKITKNVGGGGHRCAAGFSLDNLLGKTLVEFVMDNIKYE